MGGFGLDLDSASTEEKEEAEHGDQSDRFKRSDEAPNDVVD